MKQHHQEHYEVHEEYLFFQKFYGTDEMLDIKEHSQVYLIFLDEAFRKLRTQSYFLLPF